MPTPHPIGAFDDARIFPLIRRFFASKPGLTQDEAEQHFSDKHLQMARDAAPESFQEWVNQANSWAAAAELLSC